MAYGIDFYLCARTLTRCTFAAMPVCQTKRLNAKRAMSDEDDAANDCSTHSSLCRERGQSHTRLGLHAGLKLNILKRTS